jgi:hypothetical protein
MTAPDAVLQAAARLSDFLENELIMFDAGADGKFIDIPMCLRLEALGDGLRAALAAAPPPEDGLGALEDLMSRIETTYGAAVPPSGPYVLIADIYAAFGHPHLLARLTRTPETE